MSANELFLDTRLQEKSIIDGKLTHANLDKHLAGLKDVTSNVQRFDDEGCRVDPPERELKELPIKKGEPEPPKADVVPNSDPLADAWVETLPAPFQG